MKIKLYEYATIQADIANMGLQAGDVVLVLEQILDTHGKCTAYMVESFNATGQTLSVFTIEASLVKAFQKNQVLHIRSMSTSKLSYAV